MDPICPFRTPTVTLLRAKGFVLEVNRLGTKLAVLLIDSLGPMHSAVNPGDNTGLLSGGSGLTLAAAALPVSCQTQIIWHFLAKTLLLCSSSQAR